ncbi:MAG: hypothetical protein AAGE52_28760 [Myxococcota bacterium]
MADELARRGAANVIKNHLRVRKNERVVLFHLGEWPALDLLREVLAEHGAQVTEVDSSRWERTPEAKFDAAIASALKGVSASLYASPDGSGSSGTRAQRLITLIDKAGQVRHLHVPKVSLRTLATSLRADPALMASLNERLTAALSEASEIRVTSEAGTELTVGISRNYPFVSGTGVPRPGAWEGVPAGAVWFFSREVSGHYVADRIAQGSVFAVDPRDLYRNPVHLEFNRTRLSDYRCDDDATLGALQEHLARDPNAGFVGFVCLSTNYLVRNELKLFAHDAMMHGLRIMLGYSNPQLTQAPLSASVWATFHGRRHDITIDDQPLIAKGRFLSEWTEGILP